jgi:hypothetical protein
MDMRGIMARVRGRVNTSDSAAERPFRALCFGVKRGVSDGRLPVLTAKERDPHPPPRCGGTLSRNAGEGTKG